MSPYLDGELSAGELEALESHVQKCASCSEELRELQGIHRFFASAEKFEASPVFSRRVMASLTSGDIKRFSFKPLVINFAEAIAVLFIIGFGILSGSFLSNTMGLQRPGSSASLLSLDVFDATPPDSIGGVYLAMTERRYEK
jgi:anti-sigma factor RsiW